MIDTNQLSALISAFRVETEKESISPETVGKLLQDILDLLANASTDTERKVFDDWKHRASRTQMSLLNLLRRSRCCAKRKPCYRSTPSFTMSATLRAWPTWSTCFSPSKAAVCATAQPSPRPYRSMARTVCKQG